MYVVFLSTDSTGEASPPDAFEIMCKKTNNNKTLTYLTPASLVVHLNCLFKLTSLLCF